MDFLHVARGDRYRQFQMRMVSAEQHQEKKHSFFLSFFSPFSFLSTSVHMYSKPRQLGTCPSQVSCPYRLAKRWGILIGQDLDPPLPEGLGQSVREGSAMTFIPAHFPRGMAGVADRKKEMLP